MKVFIHFGAHKTGTTYLQRLMAGNSDFFNRRNSRFLAKKNAKPAINSLIQWHWDLNKGADAPENPDEFVKFLKELKSGPGESVFLSYEGLLGRMDLGRTGSIYPSAHLSSKLIKEQLGGCDIKVAFCIRDYSDFVESCYKWLVKDGIQRSFDKFYEGIDKSSLSWIPVVQALYDNFGKNNVYLWLYEDYRVKPMEIEREMLNFFYGDVAEGELQYNIEPEANVSFNERSLNTMLWLNRKISKNEDLTASERKALKNALKKAMPKVFTKENDPNKPVLLDPKERERLHDAYLRDIKALGFN